MVNLMARDVRELLLKLLESNRIPVMNMSEPAGVK